MGNLILFNTAGERTSDKAIPTQFVSWKGNSEVYCLKPCVYYVKGFGNTPGWQIDGPYEMFYVNMWLHRLSINTAQNYGYKLVRYLNWLSFRNKTYLEADEKDLNMFLIDVRFASSSGVFDISPGGMSYSNLRSYIAAITSMYTFIQSVNRSVAMPMDESRTIGSPNGFLKDIAWSSERKRILVDKHITRYAQKKKYVKWYSDKQISAILDNLPCRRDKAVFLLSLDGMRIDEILSLRVEDYDSNKQFVTAFRSKRRDTGNTGRVVALSSESVRMLEDYFLYERNPVEIAMLDGPRLIADEIFINLKRGSSYGKPLKYHNFRNTLQRAAANAGIEISQGIIRTHSGRSTSVMKDILFHVEHPELLSLEDIRIKYGWSSLSSMNPYVDTSNPAISQKNRDLLDRVKSELYEQYVEQKKKD